MKRKRFLSVLLMAALVLTLMPTVALAAQGSDFVVTGDTAGYTYGANGVLTFTSPGDYTVSMASGVTSTTTDRIVVENGVTANITLDGVNIDVSSCAFYINDNNTVNLTLVGNNLLKSGAGNPGLRVVSGASLTIGGVGMLTATGGNSDGAGIGGGETNIAGNITINGGTVTASGGGFAAGIGGGRFGNGGTVAISGGTVTASGGDGGAGIGGGYSGGGGTIYISGGSIKATGGSGGAAIGPGSGGSGGVLKNKPAAQGGVDVFLTTVTLSGAADKTAVSELTTDAGNEYGLNDVKTDGSDIYVYLPAGKHITGAKTGVPTPTAAYLGAIATASPFSSGTLYPADFDISGDPAGYTYDYQSSYALNFTQGGDYTVSMLIPGATATADKIQVSGGSAANPINLTLNNVRIQNGYCALDIKNTSYANLILTAGTTNTFTSGNSYPGIRCLPGATLTIDGSGTVTATGGNTGGAGIGGGNKTSSGTIIINSGTVTAIGNNGGAGIGGGGLGGGYGADGGTTIINGGTVTASGGTNSAGIGGGGEGADGGTIDINGGIVKANGDTNSAGIGGGKGGSGGAVTISGGIVMANGGNDAQDIGCGFNGGSQGTLEISDTAALFLRKDSCPTPTVTTHTHRTIGAYPAGGAAYGLVLTSDWSAATNIGAYLWLYTLSYDANGGLGTVPASVTQHTGTTAAVADGSGLFRTGYDFNGWKTVANSGTLYTPGHDFTFAANTTLFAQWTEKSYAIDYHLNGGTDNPNPSSYTYGAGFVLGAPTREGYTFGGWFSEEAFEHKVISISDTQTGDVTLYANWLPTTLTSDGGGVTIDLTGVTLPDGVTSVTFASDILPSGDGSFTVVFRLISDNASLGGLDQLVVYDLVLLDQNGNPITDFTGTIKVKIKIPEGMSGNLHVYWYDPGTQMLTDMNATVQNGYLVFETNHFSLYAVAQLGSGGSPENTPGIAGLPASFTMYTGGRVTWTPGTAGGTWYLDNNYFSATGSPPTFTALRSGTTDITYTVGWASQTISVTIKESQLPQTGQDGRWIWILSGVACVLFATAVFIGRGKHQKIK